MPIFAGLTLLPPLRMLRLQRLLFLLLLVALLTAGGVAKCELPDDGVNQVHTRNKIEERIMDVLNSVSVGQSIKRERNLLDDLANYIHYLKVLSLVAPRDNVEGDRDGYVEGFINVDTIGKGAKEKRRVDIEYFSQGNNYKNNLKDVRREVKRVLFT
ncbi:hypothetical protein C922_04582 [Plasmodium inui San Antonio 1]|uniref:Uncharacterized protein n=1 Tax=Plasmodium inui San Antonio 1 TaxID=1237626 RepID=W6ZWC5_9APIC|nr:hypothetical protein C922_04582 [Plasmodium inui San Antonio 1]EUD65067.1 hypothetical protein C922_04582 [Plasmodium inui San Antonio 1]